jgi:hypothetical protein
VSIRAPPVLLALLLAVLLLAFPRADTDRCNLPGTLYRLA